MLAQEVAAAQGVRDGVARACRGAQAWALGRAENADGRTWTSDAAAIAAVVSWGAATARRCELRATASARERAEGQSGRKARAGSGRRTKDRDCRATTSRRTPGATAARGAHTRPSPAWAKRALLTVGFGECQAGQDEDCWLKRASRTATPGVPSPQPTDRQQEDLCERRGEVGRCGDADGQEGLHKNNNGRTERARVSTARSATWTQEGSQRTLTTM